MDWMELGGDLIINGEAKALLYVCYQVESSWGEIPQVLYHNRIPELEFQCPRSTVKGLAVDHEHRVSYRLRKTLPQNIFIFYYAHGRPRMLHG